MKKICHILALQLITTTTFCPLSAETLPQLQQFSNQFSLGLEGFHYNYRESRLMKTKGFLYGVNAAYNYTFNNGFFFQPDVRFDYGHTNYKSNGTGSMKKEPNWLVETRIIFGKRFKLTSTTELDPYVGFGYRYKADDTDGKKTTTGHLGYYRRSQYLYIPLGLTLHQQINCDWSLSPTAEFDWFLRGRQRSDLHKTINNTQKKGYGLKGDLMLTRKFSKSSLSFGPFINYWNIKNSNIVRVSPTMGLVEPHNKTIEAGLKVKYTF
ncbi:MAG TPA: autotransporter outer membrane beta-barrel domain-containing protein [Alphaproteobacteria bacterium]|nr:autotransporter outer membrane beta-barrel domain-containing protein [Alphaproteobacteria bacterium]